MKTQEAIDHYGSIPALAAAVNAVDAITIPAIHQWKEYPPDKRQLQIERLTGGTLKAEPECQARLLGMPLQRATDRQGA